MLDNLRNQASFTPDEEEPLEPSQPEQPKPPKPRRSLDQITGTTDKQRLLLAVMLLVMVCLLGAIFLLITGKVVLPIFILKIDLPTFFHGREALFPGEVSNIPAGKVLFGNNRLLFDWQFELFARLQRQVHHWGWPRLF